MKRLSVSGIALLLLAACSSKPTLTKDQAAIIIREAKGYPRASEYDVNTVDPVSARRLLDAGLENEGMVTIDKTKKLKDIGDPVVHFTEKAKPYLIRIDPKYPNTQVVKVAETDLGEVTGIKILENEKSATVEYTLVRKDITHFAKLSDKDMSHPDTLRAELSLYDTGWKLDKKR